MGSGHIHVQLHDSRAFNFTLAILRQKHAPVSLGCKSEADSPPPAPWLLRRQYFEARRSLACNLTEQGPRSRCSGMIFSCGTVWSGICQLQRPTQTEIGLYFRHFPFFAEGIFSTLTLTSLCAFNFPHHLLPAERLIRRFLLRFCEWAQLQ